jgi:rare lipoprotein A (peptidoglycan hydrolase)
MRTQNPAILGTVFLGLGLFVLAPSANPTSARMSNPSQTSAPQSKYSAKPNTAEPKPMAVWECVSSWYGEDFDGQPTATGETYDMYGATAAHPTLPLGSIVRVVNIRNDRSEIVRINDRGPYIPGREIDVSYEVARNLGFENHGVARVRLELLKVPQRPAADHHN